MESRSPNVLQYASGAKADEAITRVRARRLVASITLLFATYHLALRILTAFSEWATPWNYVSFNVIGHHLASVAVLLAWVGGLMVWIGRRGGGRTTFYGVMAYLTIHVALWSEAIFRGGLGFLGKTWYELTENAMGSFSYLLLPIAVAVASTAPFRDVLQPCDANQRHHVSSRQMRRRIAWIVTGFGSYYTMIAACNLLSLMSDPLVVGWNEPIQEMIRQAISLASLGALLGGGMMLLNLRFGATVGLLSVVFFLSGHLWFWREYFLPGGARFGGVSLITQASQALNAWQYLLMPVAIGLLLMPPVRRIAHIRS